MTLRAPSAGAASHTRPRLPLNSLEPAPIVLKFGGSVLRSPQHIPEVVGEIYREYRRGRPVVAVVSALYGRTDRLAESARRIELEEGPAFAALLALGEHESAQLLALALERAGLPHRVAHAAELGLIADGPVHDAQPRPLDPRILRSLLQTTPILVVPGFEAQAPDGGPALLGRGGSDLSAAILATALRAELRLLKDVDGAYERDPSRLHSGAAGPPRRFRRISAERLEELGGGLVQEKAIAWANAHALEFEIAALGCSGGTRVGSGAEELEDAPQSAEPLRVALLGHGSVGRGVARRLLAEPQRYRLVAVLVRDGRRHGDLPGDLAVNTAEEVLERRPELLIDLLPGNSTHLELLQSGLARGVHLVSANKALLAQQLGALRQAAQRGRAELRFAAAVGGAMPALETARRWRGQVRGLRAVLNGTTNAVLGHLEHGRDLAEAIALAQTAGLAEADPGADLSGHDAARKLCLLAHELGFNLSLAQVKCGELRAEHGAVAQRLQTAGRALKQVASLHIRATGLEARVELIETLAGDPLGSARGPENVLELLLQDDRRIVLRALGAGRWPTTEAVLADVADLERERRRAMQLPWLDEP